MPPAIPTNVGAVDNTDGTATLSWSDNSDNETGFELERIKLRKNNSWSGATTLLAGADSTSLTDASGNGTFRYRVRAVNASGQSGWTDWVEVVVTDVAGGGSKGGGGSAKGAGKK
ncbi:MAG: fibronectin type III domain-containing protein [Gammaproteobacteria bacterium]